MAQEKFSSIATADDLTSFDFFIGIRDNGDGTFSNFRFTYAQIAALIQGYVPLTGPIPGALTTSVLLTGDEGELLTDSRLQFEPINGLFSHLDNDGFYLLTSSATDRSATLGYPGQGTSYIQVDIGSGTIAMGGNLLLNDVPLVPVNIISAADLAGVTTATIVATYATAATADYQVNTYLDVTAITTDIINIRIVWTDQHSVVQTFNSTSISTTGHNDVIKFIRALTGTNIVVSTILTNSSGSITYDVGARINQQ